MHRSDSPLKTEVNCFISTDIESRADDTEKVIDKSYEQCRVRDRACINMNRSCHKLIVILKY